MKPPVEGDIVTGLMVGLLITAPAWIAGIGLVIWLIFGRS